MRKVFVSSVIINKVNPNNPTKHASRDIDLGYKQYLFPISFILDQNITSEDEILIITGKDNSPEQEENFKYLKAEMEEILVAHNISKDKYAFYEVAELSRNEEDRDMMDVLSFTSFMKDVADHIQDDDEIYADMTYGLKSYTLAMFVAFNYVVRACNDVHIKQMIYAQFYSGGKDKPGVVDIIDITSLFRINNIVNNAQPGQKAELDQLLSFMIV